MFSFPLIRRADLIVLLAALAMPAVGAAAERSWDRDDDDVIRATWAAYDAEERGDDEAAFDRLLAVLRQHPDSPASELLVQRLSDLARTVDQHATLRGACEALLAAGVRNGEMEDWLRSRVADLLRRAGRPVDARAVAASRGFIDDWMVIGPFGESGRAVYDEPFPPESEIDLDKTYPQRRHTASWTRLLVFEPGQSIAPGRFVKRGTGAFYALAQVRVAANTPAALRLSTSTAAKVWMNGEMALGVDPFRHRIPSEHVAPATLRAGWNRVLVKVCSGRGAAFQLRLTDPDGRPIPGATVEREPSLHPAQAAAPAKSPAPAADVYPGAFWRYTRRADGPGEKSAWGHVAAAMCFDREGFTDDALHHAEIAASMLPGDAAALCFLADHERDARDLPATHRVALAREHFRKALEIDPKNVYARLALIRFDIQDKKEKEGVEQLRALSAEFPASWLIHDVIGDVCGGQGWEQEERDEREAVLRLHPEHEGTLEFWANYYARRDHFRDRALPLLRKLHQINRANRSIALHLAGIAEERGRLEDALAIVNVIADEEPSFQERAIEMRVRMLRALHRLDEAVAELEVLRARYSYRDEYPRRIGDLRYEQGRVPGALASWRAALAINPGLHELRRLIDHVEALGRGEDPLALERENDFARPFLRDVQQAIASAPDAKDYPKALAALLIDQAVLRIYPNGTSSETVTAVRKIFNDAGREAFSQVGGGGELLEARTHAADGKVYEPNNIGHGAFEMPEVKPGCVIEHCYRMERSYEPDEGFNHGGFYFQDVDGQEPFIVSEFIIIYPKDLPLLFHERNLPVSAVITEDPATGLVTRRYTVERLPLVEREPMMPSRDAIFPMVKIVTPRTWNLVAAAAKDRHLSRTDTTYLVRETTARVLAAPGEGGAPAPRGTAGKLRRLYAWVNAEIESGSNGPTATLIEKRGDREDLFLTMCEAAGIPRKPAFCRAREQFHDDTWWETPNMSYFSDYSCNLFETEEGDIWLTVGPKFAPFGVLPYPLQGGTALVLDDVGGYEFRRLPARPDEEHVVRTATLLKVKPDATVSAQYEIRLAGLQGAGLKESAKDWDNNRKKNFGENALLRHFGAPREVALDFGDLKAFGQPFTFSAEFTMDRFARKNGAEVAVRNGLEPLMLTQRFVDRAQRQFPLYALSPLHREDAVLVQAEPGMTPAAPPPDLVLLTGFGHYSLHFSSGEEGVRIVRRLATDGMRVSPREYPQLIEFCRAIDRAEESRVTFTVR